MTQLITHNKLIERRDTLKTKDLKKFFEYKEKRYALFRVQNFLDGGASPEKEHLEVSKSLEKQVADLGGVKAFAIEWDIDPLNGKVIRRDKSVWTAHEEMMNKAAVQLNAENGILTAEADKKAK